MNKRLLIFPLLLIFGIAMLCMPFFASTTASAVLSSAQGMAVMEVETGRLLNAKNEDKRLPMASTTKIVTAIVVLEHAPLNEIVTVDQRASGVEGSSIYLAAGEKISVEDLLYGLMLQSGNDAAEALAYHVGGSLPGFAAMMNETARKIGATNSHFVTPHGLHDPDHYTTAKDLAMIAAYGLRNPEFAKIVGTVDHKANREEGRYPQVIHNKNKLLTDYPGATGVKTGYTKAAGRCLVAASKRNGLHVVSVVLNCGPMFEDCATLMDAAHNEYEMTEILSAYTHLGQLDVLGSETQEVNVYSKESFAYPLNAVEKSSVFCRVELPPNVSAPLPKDSEIGKLSIYLGNRLLFSTKIYTIEEIRQTTFKDKLDIIIEKWLRR